MEFIKSFTIILGLLLLIYFAVFFVISIIKKKFGKKHTVIGVLCVCMVIGSLAIYGNYTYPFERKLDPKLYDVLEVSGAQVLTTYRPFWHSAYEPFGLYSDSFYFNTDDYLNGEENYDWPVMDFSNHTYVIVYGQEIQQLSYNVWDTIDIPIRTGAYYGHMVLKEDFYPDKVFIYELPKIRIDNNPNRDTAIGAGDPSSSTFHLALISLCCIDAVVFFLFLNCKKTMIKENPTHK